MGWGEKKIYTLIEGGTHCTIFAPLPAKKNKKNNNTVDEYCIDCAFHTPRTPRGRPGVGDHEVSSSEMAGGKKLKRRDRTRNRHG